MNKHAEKTFSRLERITHVLLINGSAIKDITLGYGKCGIALYFFLLSKKSGNPMHKKYAELLLDEMSEGIDLRIPIDLTTGFTGLGCTVELLARHGCIDTDTDDVLEAFDQRIEQIFSREYCGESDLCSIFYYLAMRYSNKKENRNLPVKNRLENRLTQTIHLIDRNLSRSPQLGSYELDQFDLLWNLPLTVLSLHQLYQTDVDKKILKSVQDKLQFASAHFLHSDIHPLNKWYLKVVLNRDSKSSNGLALPLTHLPEDLTLRHGISGLLLISALFRQDKAEQDKLIRLITDTEIKQESPYAGYELPETINKFYKLGLISGITGIGLSQIVQ